jgi:hypothetical protein
MEDPLDEGVVLPRAEEDAREEEALWVEVDGVFFAARAVAWAEFDGCACKGDKPPVITDSDNASNASFRVRFIPSPISGLL